MLVKSNFKACNNLDRMFDSFYQWPKLSAEDKTSFEVDIIDKEDKYEIKAYLPGIEKDKINIEYEDDILKITASFDEQTEQKDISYFKQERRRGEYSRSFRVKDIDPEKIEASLSNGVLSLDLMKNAKPKSKIKIN